MVSLTVRDDGVGRLMLERPDKLNALDRGFWTALPELLDRARSEGARALVVAGEGKRAFCAGGDIASFAALTHDDDRRAFQEEAMRAFIALEQSEIPTLAAVHGLAMGGGCELAMACDIVVAADDAVFALPEARFGLVPGYGAIRGPAVIGAATTKLMVYAGERLDAAAALRCGLVQRVVPAAELAAQADRLARAIAAAPASAIAVGRRLITDATAPAAVAQSIEAVATLHGTAASRDAVAAFLTPEASR